MKAFIAHCHDAPAAGELRQAHLQEHLAYIETILDEIFVAGPQRPPADATIMASLFIYRAATLERAQELLENDPYFKAGIYARVDWSEFNPAAGVWVGGKNW